MYYETDYLAHYGVKGMKWGVRRYQNEDGSLTARGKSRKNNSDSNDNKDRGLTSKQKKYVVAGLAVASIALAAYGTYKVSAIKAAKVKAAQAASEKYIKDITISGVSAKSHGYTYGSLGVSLDDAIKTASENLKKDQADALSKKAQEYANSYAKNIKEKQSIKDIRNILKNSNPSSYMEDEKRAFKKASENYSEKIVRETYNQALADIKLAKETGRSIDDIRQDKLLEGLKKAFSSSPKF